MVEATSQAFSLGCCRLDTANRYFVIDANTKETILTGDEVRLLYATTTEPGTRQLFNFAINDNVLLGFPDTCK